MGQEAHFHSHHPPVVVIVHHTCSHLSSGTFAWDGDWSWGSKMWDKHPQVKASVWGFAGGTTDKQDGEFWMSWGDFCKHFDSVDICVVSTGLDDLYLDVHEDCGCLGPTAGCITGCAWFWYDMPLRFKHKAFLRPFGVPQVCLSRSHENVLPPRWERQKGSRGLGESSGGRWLTAFRGEPATRVKGLCPVIQRRLRASSMFLTARGFVWLLYFPLSATQVSS